MVRFLGPFIRLYFRIINYLDWKKTMIVKQFTYTVPASAVTSRQVTASPNTSAVITLAAVPGPPPFRHAAHQVQWSYSAQPSGGKIQIQDGAAVILDLDIIAGGPGALSAWFSSSPGNALTITLFGGGAGIIGKLSAQTTDEPT